MAGSGYIENLVARLRELEAEALRLTEAGLAELTPEQKTYKDRLDQLEKSHSRSWFGDHSSTYFEEFQPPPPGHSFNVEWGFEPSFNGSYNPGWHIFSRDEIRAFVFEGIGENIFYEMNNLSEDTERQFSNIRDRAIDVMEALSTTITSKAIARYAAAIENEIRPYTIADYLNGCANGAPTMTRDFGEVAKGRSVPAHIQYLAPFQLLEVNQRRLQELASTLRKTIEAVSLGNHIVAATAMNSNNIFIGHGRSEQWRALKDFLKERLGFPVDEFNRVSPAGINTQERLSEMLDGCRFAFLVFTAEDTHADESMHARENVIHEAGLFQGRLGWRRAIVLLEEGCKEFSNIVGLGQIRFNKGNIASCFEEIRRVLEREGLLQNQKRA